MDLVSCNRCGRVHKRGETCPLKYKGTKRKQTQATKFRASNKWHLKSQEIREKTFYLCEICKEQGIYNYDNISVHHIEPLENNLDLGLENLNLIALCYEHHTQAERGEISKEHLIELARNRENPRI